MRKPQGGALRNDGIFLPVWTVDYAEVDTFGMLVVQDFEGVAVEDGDDLTCQVSSAEQGGNEKQDNEDCLLHKRCINCPGLRSG